MECLLDSLVGHMRAIIVARVDMVYARFDRLAQNGNGCVDVARWSPDARPGQLHGAVAHAVQCHRRARQRETAGGSNLLNHPFPPCYNHWMKDSSGLEFAYADRDVSCV